MSATAKDRENFVAAIQREYPADLGVVAACRGLMRNGATYCRLQEEYCSFEMTEHQERRHASKELACEDRVRALCSRFEPPMVPIFEGDPRGWTIVLKVPSKASTGWGGNDIGVPTS